MKRTAVIVATMVGVVLFAMSNIAPKESLGAEATAQNSVNSITSAVGNLSAVAPPEGPPVSSVPGQWVNVPGLSMAVQSGAGDNLAITVSAEVYTTSVVWVRALVDGETGAPGDVIFKMGGENWDGVRSFTFLKNNVRAGKHIVQIQWFSAAGTTARIRDRSLIAKSAAPASGTSRLVTSSAETDWVTKNTAAWEDIPGLAQTVSTENIRDLKITLSAHTAADRGRFFARAVVDGAPTADVLMEDSGNLAYGGSRSYSFVKKGVLAGNHTVRIQWLADPGGQIRIADRTLATYSSPPGEGLVAANWEGPPTSFVSTDWVDVPELNTSFTSREASANVEVEVGGEIRTHGGRTFLRALIDDQPVQPGDVSYVVTGQNFRAQSFSFIKKNVLPGTHDVKVQLAVDPGATGVLGDRTVNVSFKHRQGVDFAQPYASLAPRQGTFPVVVICFDPGRPGVNRPTAAYIRGMHRGDDGGRSMAGWYKENSGGQFVPGAFTFLGCSDSGWYLPPAGRSGTWYWDTSNYGLMWADALKAADPSFDFHAYDINGDNHITGDELVVAIVRPQNATDGYHRMATVVLDGKPAPLTVDVLDVYISADTSENARRKNVGLLSHEAAHGVLGAADMHYDKFAGYATAPGNYSLMDNHGAASHLDPFHKLKSGFITPDVVEINNWATGTIAIEAVETRQKATIIYDPARKDKEYFIAENRWFGNPPSNYDAPLPYQGIALWHIVEDVATMDRFPPPGNPGIPVARGDWGRKGVRFLGVLSRAGQSKELRYADGTSTFIWVRTATGPGEVVNVDVGRIP
nr:hypothetical protein [Massilia sp. JS1662]